MKKFTLAVTGTIFLFFCCASFAAAKPGFISGRATTEDGRPVPNFEVFFIGSNAGGDVFGRIVGRNGSYSAAAPANAVVGVYARALADFDGQKYALEMEATDGKTKNDAEPTSSGIVRDFVWKLKGLQPGKTEKSAAEATPGFPYAYYGGVVQLDADTRTTGALNSTLRRAFPAESTITVTLTPQGALVDGSEGQSITQTVSLGDAGRYNFYLRNIPFGVYSATATLTTPAGEKKQLRAKIFKERNDLQDSTWEQTVTFSFPAKEGYANGGGGGTEFAKLYLAPPGGENEAAANVQPNTAKTPATAQTNAPQPAADGDVVPPNIAEPGEADAEIEGKWATPDFSEVTPYYTIVKWDYDVIGKMIYVTLKPKTESRPRTYDIKYLDANGVEVYSQNVGLSKSSTGVGQAENFYAVLHWRENVKSIRFAKRY